jgi:Phytanoyl-CoA dioxygenase (PhyH)
VSPGGAEGQRDPEQLLAEIDHLVRLNRARRDLELERRILRLRHLAGLRLTAEAAAGAESLVPAFDRLPDGSPLPEIAATELTPELLRAAILRSGCLLVRGLLDADEAVPVADGVERVFAQLETPPPERALDGYLELFEPEGPFDLAAERIWVSGLGGAWLADSPRFMFEVLDLFERIQLRRLTAEYLGAPTVVSVDKCTLRKVRPGPGGPWHQDGAVLGRVGALNVWLSLSHCGDDAPGLDIVPRRMERTLPAGTEGACFEWSVSEAVARGAAARVAILRPTFAPGDALLFDELLLHRTASEPEMRNSRYAVETWFFRPSAFPRDYVPLAV